MPSTTEIFFERLRAGIRQKSLPPFWGSFIEINKFQDVPHLYDQYYKALNPTQKKVMSEIFWNLIKTLGPAIIKDLSNEEVKSIQTLVEKILDDANIPALTMSWHQPNTNKTLAVGITDTLKRKPVDTTTLFSASSLSKPVSAAIVLDLVAQKKWDLDTPIANFGYGPPELKNDPYYRELTTRMIIGQCSGLPNWFEKEKKFIAKPGSEFNYSGLAFDFLKEVIEKEMKKNWETIAQEFFDKVGMRNSTFKQLPASHLHDQKHDVAQGHKVDGKPNPEAVNIDSPEIPAASLLTTADDYRIFLEYCYRDNFLRSKLLTGVNKLNKDFPKTPFAANRIQWGLGMGIYKDAKQMIAFHWGNNPGSTSFCAINMKTGDSVACFVNSVNGPNVIQQLAESVVGDMTPLFQWLSNYCAFNAEKVPNTPNSITALFPLVNSLTEKGIDRHYEATPSQFSGTTLSLGNKK